MNTDRRCIVEFLSLVAIVLVALSCAVLLALMGHSDIPVVGTLQDIVKIGFGAIVALAYAARGQTPPATVETTATTTRTVTPPPLPPTDGTTGRQP